MSRLRLDGGAIRPVGSLAHPADLQMLVEGCRGVDCQQAVLHHGQHRINGAGQSRHAVAERNAVGLVDQGKHLYLQLGRDCRCDHNVGVKRMDGGSGRKGVANGRAVAILGLSHFVLLCTQDYGMVRSLIRGTNSDRRPPCSRQEDQLRTELSVSL